MGYSTSTVVTATGDVVARGTSKIVYSIHLAAAADDATVVVRTGGAAGTIRAVLSSLAETGSGLVFGGLNLFADGIHVTVTGTTPNVTVEHSV